MRIPNRRLTMYNIENSWASVRVSIPGSVFGAVQKNPAIPRNSRLEISFNSKRADIEITVSGKEYTNQIFDVILTIIVDHHLRDILINSIKRISINTPYNIAEASKIQELFVIIKVSQSMGEKAEKILIYTDTEEKNLIAYAQLL